MESASSSWTLNSRSFHTFGSPISPRLRAFAHWPFSFWSLPQHSWGLRWSRKNTLLILLANIGGDEGVGKHTSTLAWVTFTCHWSRETRCSNAAYLARPCKKANMRIKTSHQLGPKPVRTPPEAGWTRPRPNRPAQRSDSATMCTWDLSCRGPMCSSAKTPGKNVCPNWMTDAQARSLLLCRCDTRVLQIV